MAKHRHQEFLRLSAAPGQRVFRKVPLHLIVDNYGTHKQPKVKLWLEKQPAFHAALYANQFIMANFCRAMVS